MTRGFQRISHLARQSRSSLGAQTVGKCGRLSLSCEDEICRGLRGKLIWLRGDQKPCYHGHTEPDECQATLEGLSSREERGETRKSS